MIVRTLAFCLAMALGALGQQSAQQAPAEAQPKTSSPQPVPATQPFSEAVAEHVLSDFREGLVGQSERRTLAVFDRAQMPEYQQFADTITPLFGRYDSFRVRYHITQTATVGAHGVAMAEFTLEATPSAEAQPPISRTRQLRFEFARSGNLWKIVDMKPRDFFTSF